MDRLYPHPDDPGRRHAAPAIYLHVSGALLLIGRIAHPFGLLPGNAAHPLRYVGNGTNILAMMNAMVCLGAIILGL
jgi:hypothetical protein